jgi:hypothetical protein
MTKEDVEAAAHGLWEMATDARARAARRISTSRPKRSTRSSGSWRRTTAS